MRCGRALGCLLAAGLALTLNGRGAAGAQALRHEPVPQPEPGSAPGRRLDWDEAFSDRSGSRPVHFVAEYTDGKGAVHRLEEWRVGLAHLRRKTDARIDLHADATGPLKAGQPAEYLWQIFDMEKRVEHRVSTAGMMRAGMLYSYYAMAHVLSRPAGALEVHAVAEAPLRRAGMVGRWYEVDARGQAATRVCWAADWGVPLETRVQDAGRWRTVFTMVAMDQHVAPAVFAVDARGFQVRNVDELSAED